METLVNCPATNAIHLVRSQVELEDQISRPFGATRVLNRHVARIIIVDELEVVRHGVRSLIDGQLRYEVVGSTDGSNALDVARRTNPDLAVLDCSHPRTRGLSLARQLKEEFPRLEIVLFLSFNLECVIQEAIEIGVVGMVLKSEHEQTLLATLNATSGHRRYVSPALADAWYYATRRGCSGFLTRREHEIVQQIAEGKTYSEVALHLGISKKTMEAHRTNAMTKLGLSTTADLVRYAVRNGLVVA